MLISTVSATSLLVPPTSPTNMITLTTAVSPPPISPLLIAKDEEQTATAVLRHGGVSSSSPSDYISSLHKSPQPLRTLSPPLPSASHREGGSSGGGGVFADGSPLVVGGGHPREGQAASLLGNKYLLLEELEGSSLHRCLHIRTRQEFVCKVRPLAVLMIQTTYRTGAYYY